MENQFLVLHVDHSSTAIVEGRLTKESYKEFKKALGYKPENVKFMLRTMLEKAKAKEIARARRFCEEPNENNYKWLEAWDGYKSNVCYNKGKCTCHIKKDYTHFSTGLLTKAREFFNKYNISYKFVDKRVLAKKTKSFSLSADFEQRDYQIDVINKACNKQRGIIKCATGSGKTAIAAGIIAKLSISPFIVYVTSKDLLHQAHNEFTRFIRSNGGSIDIGIIGDGKCEIKDINVMTVQTAVRALGGKYQKYDEEDKGDDTTDISSSKKDIKDLIYSAKGITGDECQYWTAATCQIISDCSVSAHYRFGQSASPWRDLGDDILIDACFGRCIADISASFLIDRGYLVAPEIFFIQNKGVTGLKYSSYPKIYSQAIVNNSKRNEWIAKIAIRMHKEGRLPLVLVKQIQHGNILNNLIENSVFLSGKISSKKRKEHLEKMRKRECGITIASVIFDEGVDIRPLDTLILAGGGKSQTRALQRIGRILRTYPGKENAIAIDFDDHCKYLHKHSQKRRKIYSVEKRFTIKDVDMD